jgi:hypothetical protein
LSVSFLDLSHGVISLKSLGQVKFGECNCSRPSAQVKNSQERLEPVQLRSLLTCFVSRSLPPTVDELPNGC